MYREQFNILNVFSINWTGKIKTFQCLCNLLWSKLQVTVRQSWLTMTVYAKHICLKVPKNLYSDIIVLRFFNADLQGVVWQSLKHCHLWIASKWNQQVQYVHTKLENMMRSDLLLIKKSSRKCPSLYKIHSIYVTL